MKAKLLFLAIAALLVAGGWWVVSEGRRSNVTDKSSMDVGAQRPGQMLRPPDPIRKFRDLTPEQRVELARKGPVGG